ncbi:phosphoribosylaminoimidazole carboxylase [Aureococcus anophagefferens]|nr:phosphoribosylaminoimidazole carboxylase [Aureococcus anophagefferens]
MSTPPLVGVIMGSDSDLPVMKACCEMLDKFGVPYECTIVSAHRTPQRLCEYASGAKARGLRVVVAGAGGGAPAGHDAARRAVATVAIGNATNAGVLAARILASAPGMDALAARLQAYADAAQRRSAKARRRGAGYAAYLAADGAPDTRHEDGHVSTRVAPAREPRGRSGAARRRAGDRFTSTATPRPSSGSAKANIWPRPAWPNAWRVAPACSSP